MKWSISKSKVFRTCQRKWYFSSVVANAIAKDPVRREAYILNNLRSIYAWRGSLVDDVLSRKLIPALNNNEKPNFSKLKNFAMWIADRQLDYALSNGIRENGFVKSKIGNDFAAIVEVDYGEKLEDDVIAKAKEDIVLAIKNLFTNMEKTRNTLKGGSFLAAQRTLSFNFSGVNVIAIPDVIVFSESDTPAIVDWKVHANSAWDSRLQLALYALALSRCNPQKGFPENWNGCDPRKVKIIEAQLLTGTEREYKISEEDISELEDYIWMTGHQMLKAIDGIQSKEYCPDIFPVTSNSYICKKCNFRKMCWEDNYAKS